MRLAFGLYCVLGFASAADLTGFTEDFPPYNYVEKGLHAGLANEIIDRIVAKTGLSIDRQERPWPRALYENEKTTNSLLYSTMRTPERVAKYRWVGPYDNCGLWLIKLKSRTDIQLKSLDDAKKYTLAMRKGDAGYDYLLSVGFSTAQIDISANGDPIRKLYRGWGDFIVGMPIYYTPIAKKWGLDPLQMEAVLPVQDGVGCYFAFNLKVDPKLFQRFADGFAQLEKSGELKKIHASYLK